MNGRAFKLGTFSKSGGKPFAAIVLDDSAIGIAEAAKATGKPAPAGATLQDMLDDWDRSFAQLQEIVRKVPVADHVIRYALQFTRLTRRTEGGCPPFVNDYVGWGAGPRASQYLVLAAKARAVLYGRYHVATEDIRAIAGPVLRHRIITNFNAEAEGLKPDDIVARLIQSVPVDEHEAEQSGKLPKIFKSAHAG